MKLSPMQERFILHWGEMGSRWGVNRTVAQIHALLFLSDRPLTADEICDTLNLARSNVSTSVKELGSWGLVKLVHVLGDRRDHFETPKDVWEIFRIITQERRKREIDPTLSMLRSAVLDSPMGTADQRAQVRMKEVLEFLETGNAWLDEMHKLPPATVLKMLKMGAKIQSLLKPASKSANESTKEDSEITEESEKQKTLAQIDLFGR
ncbi:ArsR family transcriptional regulator [Ahniella affigens]|uniref:HTH-type transcriptional regulator n=1 Tax=Ahniella affigens TaxID=2021234 RepID=A0A2P1PP61_9GAMM|nr:GbsR/MarR family transcriptional regulator [Ahniella affigens]AVP96634.1 ArsR family transcriptional regulator [Ahniella affigens]